MRNVVAMLALLTGCGAAAPAARPPDPSAAPVARTCAPAPAPTPRSVLSSSLVRALHHDHAAPVADALCTCADALSAPLPSTVRATLALVPGRGRADAPHALLDLDGVIVDADGSLDACFAARVRAMRSPVRVIGSDVVPDRDPTDERVVMPFVVFVSPLQPASPPRSSAR